MLILRFVEILERHVFAHRGHHGGRRHDLFGMYLAQLQETADGLGFLGFEHPFFHAHVDHGLHFFATHGELCFVAAHHARDQLRKQHQG